MNEIEKIKTREDVEAFCVKQVAQLYANMFKLGKFNQVVAEYSIIMVRLGQHLSNTGLIEEFEEFYREVK
jgi:hypothetical protein